MAHVRIPAVGDRIGDKPRLLDLDQETIASLSRLTLQKPIRECKIGVIIINDDAKLIRQEALGILMQLKDKCAALKMKGRSDIGLELAIEPGFVPDILLIIIPGNERDKPELALLKRNIMELRQRNNRIFIGLFHGSGLKTEPEDDADMSPNMIRPISAQNEILTHLKFYRPRGEIGV